MGNRSGLLAAFALLLCATVAAAEETAAPATLEELDTRLAAAFSATHVPGAEVALIEDGKIVLIKSYGLADVARRIPATPASVFRAGSISKSITAIAAMTLVEQGKLALEMKLADFAPEVKFVNRWESTHPVRLVHLLEHTTGWPDVSTRVLALDEKSWSVLQGVQATSPEFVSRWAPGRFAVYNNAGPAVAGVMIEKASGQTFDAYVVEHVLRPMGMPTADFDLTPALAEHLAKSYAPDGSEVPFQYIVLPPAGSLNTNVGELAQLVRFFLGRGTVDGTTILTPESVARIERSESNVASPHGFVMGYGLGNAVFPEKGINFRGHNGEIDAFTSVYGYLARNRSGYVVMANGGGGANFATPLADLIEHYLTRGLALEPPPTVPIGDDVLASYAGLYRTVTPPNALLRPLVEILGLTRVSARAGKLVISGNDFLPASPHLFRRFDRAQPSLAFVEDGGETYKVSAFSTAIREPLWRAILIVAALALIALGALFAVVMTPVWLISGLRGRLRTRGGWLVRFAPLAALAAMALTFGMTIAVIAGAGTSALHRLSTVGPYALTIFAASVLFPLLAGLGLWLSLRTREAPLVIRLYAGLTATSLLAFSAYAWMIGWVGARTWLM